MAKHRTSIPAEVAAQVLFAADRTCCVCRQRKRVQIHHLDEDPSNHEHDNLAVLCFDCHGETQIHGGFDRKLDAHQIILYRADWVATVARLRNRGAEPERLNVPIGTVAPSPNVLPVRPWHTRVCLGNRGVAVEQPGAPLTALVVPFRNDPTQERPEVSAVSQLVATA